MILAAGYGTRLGPITKYVPKPMLPMVGAPLVRWAVLWLRHHGIREIVVNLHHLGEQIESELGDGRRLGVEIAYSREAGQILGTGGGLRQARHLLEQDPETPIVAINGKVMLDLDLGAVLAFHREKAAEATLVLRDDPNAERWGSFGLDEDGRIVRMLGLEHPEARRTGPLRMFTGVQVFAPRFLDRVPPEGEACIVRTAVRGAFDDGQGLYGYVMDGYWWEHSTVDRYLDGVEHVLAGRARLPHADAPIARIDDSASVDPSARIEGPVFVGPRARIEAGAVVGPYCAVEADAVVEGGARLERTVVFPGARARDTQRRAAVVRDGAAGCDVAVFGDVRAAPDDPR